MPDWKQEIRRRLANLKLEPTLDVYNVFNSNAVTSSVTTIGSSLGRPSAIIVGRLVRAGWHMTF